MKERQEHEFYERLRRDWVRPFQRRCKAVKEPNRSGYWGRCELRAGHDGDHALERGMEAPSWSTEWTRGIDDRG